MATWKEELETIVMPAISRSSVIREFAMGQGVLDETGAIIRRNFTGEHVMLFADEAGFTAAGEGVCRSLAAAGLKVSKQIIPASPLPSASVDLAEQFLHDLSLADAIPVSVGSGVMNDLVKYAAFQLKRPYAVVPTAASMDGYVSAGAPLSQNGFKITIPTRAPEGIIADLDIIAAAPAEMTGWGYGDLAGKIPAGGDWLIADMLGIEAIDDVAWPMVQDNLGSWLSNPDLLRKGDFGAIARLFSGLTIVGVAMEFYGSSRPASGADHQIAHMWEMEELKHEGRKVSHGACVSIGCRTALALYDWLVGQDLMTLDVAAIADSAPALSAKFKTIDAAFSDPEIASRAKVQTEAKHIDRQAHLDRLTRLVRMWPDMRNRLKSHLIRMENMETMLRLAGAPVMASDIGVSPAHHKATVYASRFIRSRYTILDLLDETGLLGPAVEEVFARPSFGA